MLTFTYERVISSIMAFFLDTTREHRLKDLFVRSLIEASGLNPNDYLGDFTAETEVYTENGNFIDILLRNEQRNIVIENKIYASLYNDLNDYYKTATEKQKEPPLGIVLSLQPMKIDNPKFNGVTYSSLLTQVKKNMGFYLMKSNPKYTPFLLDFINNIECLLNGEVMDKELNEFMREHEKEAIEFVEKVNEVRKELRGKVNVVTALLNERITDKTNLEIWKWRDNQEIIDDAVVDYYPTENLDIAFDSYIKLDGWSFVLWNRNENVGKTTSLTDFIAKSSLDGTWKSDDGIEKYWLTKTFPFDTSLETVCEYTATIVGKLKAFSF